MIVMVLMLDFFEALISTTEHKTLKYFFLFSEKIRLDILSCR